jgi:hypothetical protein
MSNEAAELQVRFTRLAAYTEFVLEGMVLAKNAWLISRVERAMAAMELCYRWTGKDDLLPEMIWRLIFRDEHPYPLGLVSPSQALDDGWASVRKARGAKYAALCERLSPRPTLAN